MIHIFSISVMTPARAFNNSLCCVKYDLWERELGLNTGSRVTSWEAGWVPVGALQGLGIALNKQRLRATTAEQIFEHF